MSRMTTQFSVKPKRLLGIIEEPFRFGRQMHGRMPPHGEWACVERARNDSNGTDASRKTRKPTRGSDGGWLAGAVENQGNSNETHPEKRNSRMMDAPGGEPGSVILANSFRSGRRCISESRDSATMTRCPLPSPPLDIVLPPEREPWRTRAANVTCCASYMRRRIQ